MRYNDAIESAFVTEEKTMVTIYDVAKKTGFSSTTVSKALNNYSDVSEKTKQEILRAAAEMGYLPNTNAQSLSTKKSHMIGVVFAEENGVGMKHPFFNAVIESFRKHAEREGYDLIFASRNLRNRDVSYLEHFMYRGVDGVIVFCSRADDSQIQDLINSKLPIVVIDMMEAPCSTVYSDNVEGGKLAVQHLHSLGHERIAHIAGSFINAVGEARAKGYQKGMQEIGLSIRDGYLVDGGFFSIEEGKLAMNKLLDLEVQPTAVFTAGDHMAIGAIEAIKERGLRVPEDISIIGFDDIDMVQYITPKLTTIRQDTDLMGNQAAQILIEQITHKKKVISSNVIPVELVSR